MNKNSNGDENDDNIVGNSKRFWPCILCFFFFLFSH